MKLSKNKKVEKKSTPTHFDSQNKRSNSAIGSFFGFDSVNNITAEGSPILRRPSLGESRYTMRGFSKNSPRTNSPRTNSPRFFDKLLSPRSARDSPRKFELKSDTNEDDLNENKLNFPTTPVDSDPIYANEKQRSLSLPTSLPIMNKQKMKSLSCMYENMKYDEVIQEEKMRLGKTNEFSPFLLLKSLEKENALPSTYFNEVPLLFHE
eukprot:gene1038-9942_t